MNEKTYILTRDREAELIGKTGKLLMMCIALAPIPNLSYAAIFLAYLGFGMVVREVYMIHS